MNNSKGLFHKMLNFDTMITPIVIKVLYFINAVIVILVGLATLFTGLASRYSSGWQVIGGLLIIVVGPFIVRISYELIIVIFKINENLQKISSKSEEGFDYYQ